jgi:hypothetical protein
MKDKKWLDAVPFFQLVVSSITLKNLFSLTPFTLSFCQISR